MIPKLHNFGVASLPFLLNLYDFAEQSLNHRWCLIYQMKLELQRLDINRARPIWIGISQFRTLRQNQLISTKTSEKVIDFWEEKGEMKNKRIANNNEYEVSTCVCTIVFSVDISAFSNFKTYIMSK